MMKFILASRRKPQDTQEKFFYEWGIIHVALMITNPSTQRAFTRYAQHYTINGVSSDLLWHPLSPMAWDNMADHWLEKLEDLGTSVRSEDYVSACSRTNSATTISRWNWPSGRVITRRRIPEWRCQTDPLFRQESRDIPGRVRPPLEGRTCALSGGGAATVGRAAQVRAESHAAPGSASFQGHAVRGGRRRAAWRHRGILVQRTG